MRNKKTTWTWTDYLYMIISNKTKILQIWTNSGTGLESRIRRSQNDTPQKDQITFTMTLWFLKSFEFPTHCLLFELVMLLFFHQYLCKSRYRRVWKIDEIGQGQQNWTWMCLNHLLKNPIKWSWQYNSS